MSTTGEELLKSFDLLLETEKHQVASEIMRQAFAFTTELDDADLAAVFAEIAERERKLAEEGIEDYERALASEDAE